MNMGMRALGFIGMGLLLALTVTAAPSGLLNDTGQTQCLNVFGNALEECTPENSGDDSPYPGQDGRYGRDAAAKYPEQSGFTKPEGSGGHGGFAFTPLDVNGNPIPLVGDPPVPAETPRCVWDRVTNLIWEVKTDDGGLQDKDWTYFGGDTGGGGNCINIGNCNIKNYVDALNAASICPVGGADNWHLPTRRELLSLVNYNLVSPAIETAFFPNTKSSYYYSSDIYSNLRWSVGFHEGNAFGYTNSEESNQYFVRLVRNGPGDNVIQKTFTDNGDGTITDNVTGLMWDQCSWGQTWKSGPICSGSAPRLDWTAALGTAVAANHQNWRGHNDWRLPNFTELETLVVIAKSNPPLIDTSAFPNTQSNTYWSSTHYAWDTSFAWVVDFHWGFINNSFQDPLGHIRLVRGGKTFSRYDPNFIKKQVEASIPPAGKIYDGTTTAKVDSCWLIGIDSGDDVSCRVLDASFAFPDVYRRRQQNYVEASVKLEGADAFRYELYNPYPQAPGGIDPRPITASITATGKVYDGFYDATITSITLHNLIGDVTLLTPTVQAKFNGEDPLTGSFMGYFSDANTGTNKTIKLPH